MDPSRVRREMQAIVNLLNSGRTRTGFNDDKIIMVLGADDAAKREFFRIVSQGRQQGTTTNGVLPERVVDDETQSVYYDIPTFHGNRSHPENIASAYFTKRVTDAASEVKILYLYDSKSFGNNGVENVLDLLHFTTKLVNDVDKFASSIAFIIINNGTSDSVVLDKVVSTLRETITALLSSNSVQNQINVINNVLTRDGDTYARIGIVDYVNTTASFTPQRKIIHKIVGNNIEFTSTSEEDFTHPMPQESVKEIHHLAEGIKDNVISEVSLMGGELENQYRHRERSFTNINSIRGEFESAWNGMVSLLTSNDLQDFVRETVTRSRSLQIALPRRQLNNIAEDAGYFQILEGVATIPSFQGGFWLSGLNDTMRYFTDSLTWYEFLDDAYKRMEQHEIQSDKEKHYRTCNSKLEEIARRNGTRTGKDLEECLNQIGIHNRGIADLSLNDQRLQEIRSVVDMTLNHEEKVSCVSPNKLELEGRFVRLSQVNSVTCNYTVTFMEVLASEKLFIDANITATNLGRDVIMIAPTWEVVNPRQIVIGGGTNTTGSFLGIGRTFINGDDLLISAQDQTARAVSLVCTDGTCGPRQTPLCATRTVLQSNVDQAVDSMVDACQESVRAMYHNYYTNFNASDIWNEVCEKPVGNEETVTIINVDKPYKVTHKHPGYMQVAYRANTQVSYLSSCLNECDAVSGTGSIRHCSDQGRNAALHSSVHASITKYRSQLREHLLLNSLTREAGLNFLELLDKQAVVRKMQTTHGLIQEFLELEEEFDRLRKGIPVLFLYQSLRDRIDYYLEHPKSSESSLEHQKVLSYLLTSCLGRIYSINVDRNLVIDVRGYVELALNRVSQLATIMSEEQYQETIRRENEVFQESIMATVSEAQALIDERILPEIDAIGGRLDDSIEALVNETLQLQEDMLAERDRLKEAYDRLKSRMGWRIFFHSMNFVGSVISGLGGKASLAGDLISMGADWLNTLVDMDVDLNDLHLPPGVDNALNQATDQLRQNRRTTLMLLGDAEQKLEEFMDDSSPDKLVEVYNEIKSLRREVEAETNLLDADAVARVEKGRSRILGWLVDTDWRNKTISERANQVGDAISLIGRGSLTLYESIRDDRSKLGVVGQAIRQAEEMYNSLIQYEALIYSVMMPLVSNMIEYVQQVAGNAGSQSNVALLVTQWDISGNLNDVRRDLRRMTEGFNSQDDILYSIDEMDAAMTVLINIYERIQNYYEQGRLAAFIASIQRGRISEISVRDPELNRAMTTLIDRLRLNIVTGQYERAMVAYKQFVFPFAEQYLREFSLTDLDYEQNDTTVLVHDMENKIRLMLLKLTESDVSITDYDRFKHANVDFVENSWIPAFAVWKNETYSQSINRLLSGQEITLRADITEAIDYDAVKFRLVGLNIKPLEENLQEKLHRDLQNFTVVLKHLGNSIYRCGNNFYTIPSEVQTITYTFDQRSNGDPIQTNVVYDKLKTGNYILSPYATWSIKLESFTGDYEMLEAYKGKVDLELEGRGQYVEPSGVSSETCYSLETYYDTEDVVSQMFNMDLFDDDGAAEVASRLSRSRRYIHPDPPELSAHNTGSPSKRSFVANALNWVKWSTCSLNNWFSGVASDITLESNLLSSYGTTPIGFTGDDLKTAGLTDVSQLNAHGNLLLFDTLIRKCTGVKHGRNTHYEIKHFDGYEAGPKEHGGSLAYRYYAPS